MLKLKPEYLTKNGRREYAVLTMKDFARVQEALQDAEDLRILRESRRRNAKSPTYTAAEVKRRLDLVHGKAAKAR